MMALRFGLILTLMTSAAAHAGSRVDEILAQVQRHSAPPDERVDLRMIVREADGTRKTRELTILRKNDGEDRALIRLEKPSDLRGLSLLTVNEGGDEDQYLYLPSLKKSRRILGSNKKGRFLDSEISYEDLETSTYRDFNNSIVKESATSMQIESQLKPGADSSYGRIVTWIARPNERITRIDYFDRHGRFLKRALFRNYQRLGAQFWRARDVTVVNVQNHRKTQLLVKTVSLKKIDRDQVSLASLDD